MGSRQLITAVWYCVMGDLIKLQRRVGKELWEMTDDELMAFLLEDNG